MYTGPSPPIIDQYQRSIRCVTGHEHLWIYIETPNPNKGSGCILGVLGLLLTPFLIGIPILFYGLKMSTDRFGYYQCKICGFTYHKP